MRACLWRLSDVRVPKGNGARSTLQAWWPTSMPVLNLKMEQEKPLKLQPVNPQQLTVPHFWADMVSSAPLHPRHEMKQK
jgi:hypothetical protein